MNSERTFQNYQSLSPQHIPGMSQRYKTAKILVQRFPDKAIELVLDRYNLGEVEYHLEVACNAKDLSFHNVMSSNGDATTSQLPNHQVRRRHASEPDRVTGLPSPAPSHVDSLPRSELQSPLHRSEFIYALPSNGGKWPLTMRNSERSHNLVREDVVRDRLKLNLENLTSPVSVCYNDMLLTTSQQVSFTWMRHDGSLTHYTTFYVVSTLTDVDLVKGGLKHEDVFAQPHDGVYPSVLL